MLAPTTCPMCGERVGWKKVDVESRFSLGKAAIGTVVLGPIGVLCGLWGKSKDVYYCEKCSFKHEYDVESKR